MVASMANHPLQASKTVTSQGLFRAVPPPVCTECRSRGCHSGRQDRRVTPVGLGKMFVGGSGWCVFAVGRREWWSGAESCAGAWGELTCPPRLRHSQLGDDLLGQFFLSAWHGMPSFGFDTTRFAAVVVPPNRSQVVLSVGLRFAEVRNLKSACRAIWRTPCMRRTLQKLQPYALNPHKNHQLPSVGVILGQTLYQLVTVKLIV